jgi:hypothetical protein
MPTLSDIEKAIATLPEDELAAFRRWFEAFDAARFDEKIAQDSEAGRLDALAAAALAEHAEGKSRAL